MRYYKGCTALYIGTALQLLKIFWRSLVSLASRFKSRCSSLSFIVSSWSAAQQLIRNCWCNLGRRVDGTRKIAGMQTLLLFEIIVVKAAIMFSCAHRR